MVPLESWETMYMMKAAYSATKSIEQWPAGVVSGCGENTGPESAELLLSY